MTATSRLNPEALKPYRTRKVPRKPNPRITITFTSWNSAVKKRNKDDKPFRYTHDIDRVTDTSSNVMKYFLLSYAP